MLHGAGCQFREGLGGVREAGAAESASGPPPAPPSLARLRGPVRLPPAGVVEPQVQTLIIMKRHASFGR